MFSLKTLKNYFTGRNFPLIKSRHREIKVIVFANYNYLPVLENWLAAMKKIDVKNYLIISLDEKLHHHLGEQNINSLLRPCELDLGKLWIHRVDVILELMEKGYDIIHSDADAVWLKDPQPYLQKLPHDMIFSQGTIWPPDVQEKWGFVLCCGFFFLRSNPQTLQFIKELAQRVREDKDDQVSCNRLLLEKNVIWDKPSDLYTIDFRGKQFVCSKQARTGKSKDLDIALLPHSAFQRLFEETDDVYVRHLISEKNSGNILEVLEQYGCRFN